MRIACLTLALPFTTGRFHGCILTLKINHLFSLPRTLAWFLIWGGLFLKICKLIVFNIWFLSLLLNLRQFDLKKKKLFTNKVCISFDLCSLDPSQSVLYMMWLLQLVPWHMWWVHHTHLSNADLTLLDLHKQQFSFTVCRSWSHKERKKNKLATALCSGKQNPRGLCCWSTQKQNHYQRESEEKPKV